MAAAAMSCGGNENGEAPRTVEPLGNAVAGQQLVRRYGCVACHHVPGTRFPRVDVGPPLDGWSRRRYLAGIIENTPEQLVQWITMPQSVAPGTAMPNLGVSDEDARDIAAYLYTLR